MRKLYFISFTILLIASICCVIILLPYHFYYKALNTGISSKYINIDFTNIDKDNFLAPKNLIVSKLVNNKNYSTSDFREFHLKNFVIPIPVNNLNYIILPEMYKIYKKINLALRFKNLADKEIFRIDFLERFTFSHDLYKYKIFQLPYFKNYILKYSMEKIWKDMFSKNLNIEELKTRFNPLRFKSYLKIDYRQLVYNLYILHLRIKYFKDASNFQYLKKKSRSIGIIEVTSKNKYLYNKYIAHIFINRRIERVMISIKRNDKNSLRLLTNILKNIKPKQDEKDAAIENYAFFKSLKYEKKISQLGFLAMFSAWSHDLLNENYIKELIFWLERNKSLNKERLKIFHDFAFKTYGSNFTTVKSKLIETEEVKIEREMLEEQEDRLNTNVESLIKENNNSSTEDILFKLNKAKNKRKDQKIPQTNQIRMH